MNDTHLLYIEDDPVEAHLIQQCLARCGYDVAVAASGESGLELFKAEHFDLLIVDYRLQGCDGLEVLRAAKSLQPDVPVIMLSGLGDAGVAAEAIKQGVSDYVVKDIRGTYLDVLPTILDRVLEKPRLTQEKHQAELALAEEREFSRIVMDQITQGLAVFDSKLDLVLCNQAFLMLGNYPEALGQRGTPLSKLQACHSAKKNKTTGGPGLLWGLNEAIRGGSFFYERVTPSGQVLEVRGGPLPQGGAMVTLSDITEHKRSEEHIRYLAQHDVLTGLPNRLMFQEMLQHEMARSKRSGKGGALLFIDLDDFKSVNDTQGHDMGDELLRQVASRLKSSLRAADVVARLGGDEFTVLLAGIQDDAAATTVAAHIIEKLTQPFLLSRGQASISASIGIVRYPQEGATADWLMYKADQAMYAAKAAGKARYLIAEGS
jgi:diguanylate cyclase (GGDEF)-like protein